MDFLIIISIIENIVFQHLLVPSIAKMVSAIKLGSYWRFFVLEDEKEKEVILGGNDSNIAN